MVFCPVFAVVLSLPLWRFLILLVRTRSAPLWVLLQRWEAQHGPCHSLLLVQGGSAPLWVLLQRWEAEHMPFPAPRSRQNAHTELGIVAFPALGRAEQDGAVLAAAAQQPFKAGAELSTPPGFS